MLSFAFFIAVYLVGNELSTRFALPIPGSIIGLGLVFTLLAVRGKVDAPLKESADVMLRYLPLMLVPIGVGVVKLVGAVPQGISVLLLVLVAALAFGGVAAAKITQRLLAWHHKSQHGIPQTADARPVGAAAAQPARHG